MIRKATAFDFSEDSILEAKKRAFELDLDFNYIVADCNKFTTEAKIFDLVINHAAMHHVAYINRLTYQISKALKDSSSLYVGFDYVGSHRNQYSWPMWSEMVQINNSLPEKYQVQLTYPHIKTMLATDPTEAIHSELQLDLLKQYFDIKQYTPLGGAIAYALLFQNTKLHQDQDTEDGIQTINKIIAADKSFCDEYPECNLFAFWIATAKEQSHLTNTQIEGLQSMEDFRELTAQKNDGRYYAPNALEIIYDDFDKRIREKSYQVELIWRNKYDAILKSQENIFNIKSWRAFKLLKKILGR